MKTTTRIRRLIAERDRREAQGHHIRMCRNCAGSGRVAGRRPKCRVCGGQCWVWEAGQ